MALPTTLRACPLPYKKIAGDLTNDEEVLLGLELPVSILNDQVAGPLNAEQREYVQIIARNMQQLNVMIDDLLEMTRAETGKLTVELQWTRLDSAIVEVVEDLSPGARQKDIVLNTELPQESPLVYADPARLRQILMNLVQNAIKFTAAGKITVRARLPETDWQFVIVEVEDTGCGFPPPRRRRRFSSAFTKCPGHPSQAERGWALDLTSAKS